MALDFDLERMRLIETNYFLWDDFSDGTLTTSSPQGETGWQLITVGTSTISVINYAGRVGVKRYATASKAGSRNTLAREIDMFPMALSGWNMQFAILYPALPQTIIRTGFMNSFVGAQNEYAYFEKLDGETNWFSATRASAGAENRQNTGITADTSFHIYRLRKNPSGQWEFYIDGSLKTTHTSSLPLLAAAPSIQLETTTGSARNFDLDYIVLSAKGFANR